MMATIRWISTVIIAAGLGGAVLPAVAGPAAVADGWRVLESHGGARFQPVGEQSWWPVRTGSTIPPGSIVATGSSGFLIVARGGESITVRPNSRVALPAAATGDQVRQTAGDLRYRITRVPDRRFSVETPYLSLLVKGTVFEVLVGERGAEVEVTDGRVRVDAARGQTVELSPGQGARIAPGAQADLQFRAAPESPFTTTRSPRTATAAAYTRHGSGQVTGDRPPRPPQETARSARTDSAPGDSDRSPSQAAPGPDRSMPRVEERVATVRGGDAVAASADGAPQAPAQAAADPSEARVAAGAVRNSGVEIGFSDGRMWIDTARAQIAAARPRQDAIVRDQDAIVRIAPADSQAATGNDGSEAAPPPQHQMAAAAPGEDRAGSPTVPPRESAETSERTGQAPRAGQGGAGGWRRSDTVVWTILLAVAVTLWWRLRRSPSRQTSGHGTGWRWPWQRSSHNPSGASAGSASAGPALRRAVRNGT